MSSKTPKPDGPIVDQLLENGRAFSFFQALRLLRHKVRAGGGSGQPDMSSQIRIRPRLSLAFPSADIDRVEQLNKEDDPTYRITATFLGLYGTTSPLPTFYTEDLLRDSSNDQTVSRDFVDVLNQRLYDLLFQGWLKYRNFIQVTEEKNIAHLERLFCLTGLGSEELRNSQADGQLAYGLLRYIGLLTQFPRSASGLGTLLSDALQGIPLRIVPCIMRKANIPEAQQLRIGMSGNQLGMDSYLGHEIEDRMGKFRIQIGPLDQAGFLQFTPGEKGYMLLTTLTEIYAIDPLIYEVELILAECQARTVCLGDPIRSVLGVTTWVFSQEYLGEVRTRFTVNRQ